MALGDTLATFEPTDGKPPSSNYATIDHRSGPEDSEIDVLDFDDTTAEKIDFARTMPRFYNGGEITVYVGWMASDTTVGPDDVRWEADFKSITDDADDLDTKTFIGEQEVTDTEPSASGEISIAEIVLTAAQVGNIQPGEKFFLRISRDPTHGDDNLVGDAELLFVELKESS